MFSDMSDYFPGKVLQFEFISLSNKSPYQVRFVHYNKLSKGP